jgi:hypothetical protein
MIIKIGEGGKGFASDKAPADAEILSYPGEKCGIQLGLIIEER